MLAAVVGLVLASPGAANAHIRVTHSTPAAGDTVTTPVHELRVTFSQAVARQYTRLTLVDAAGVQVATGGTPADSTLREYTLDLPVALRNGQ